MFFLIGGYDENETYGRLFQISIPDNPKPVEQIENNFGIIWGGTYKSENYTLNVHDALQTF